MEIVSPSNSKAATANKVHLYFAHGAQEIWVVSLKRKVTVYAHGMEAARSQLVGNVEF